ncbi:MAG: pimeloyl-ACP methyl ester esterase BioH [Methylophilaceae bacterium]
MSLHMEIYGDGQPEIYGTSQQNSQPLLLIHGWGMHGGVWQPIVAQLAQHFSLYIVDLPGMGFSTTASSGDLSAIAEQVIATLPTNETGWNVCGWSLGGQVAMRMALQRPDLIERLVLVGATPKFVNDDSWQLGMDASVFQQFADNISQDYATTLMKFLTLQCMRASDARNTIKQLRESFAKRPVPSIATLQSALDILLASDLRAEVKQLGQATLIVHGDRDSLAPVAAAHWLAEHLPSAQLVEIAGASHAPFLSHPEQFMQALLAFLQPEFSEIKAI